MFRRFGSQVTVIEREAHLLSREDTDVSEEMAKILREDGIDDFSERQSRPSSERTTMSLSDRRRRPAAGDILGSHLLVATGRTPNTGGLGLDLAGVEMDEHGFVKANERLETNVPGVYVIGDCKGGPQFTHISYDDFRILCANLWTARRARPTTGPSPTPSSPTRSWAASG